jgi:hypothetical protein
MGQIKTGTTPTLPSKKIKSWWSLNVFGEELKVLEKTLAVLEQIWQQEHMK